MDTQTILKIMLGQNEVIKIYLGNDLVYSEN